jgi:prolyl oligopeptidase
MEAIIAEVGFEGGIPEFNEFLRSDPRFYYDTPEALLAAYQAASKRIDPELVKLFGRLPRMPYGVRPIPMAQAPDTTTAYYSRPAADGSRPGWYYVNLYRPEVRPIYQIEVLSVHEAVPGHHLQIALAQELGDLPNFRRNSSVTAFVEGWGLYSERLGYEMGLYTDPYSRYGQKIYDMWRAVRLVVDTGIHYFGWSRERAIDYFKDNAAKTETDIVNEIDRYIGWPGQALAYKVGQLKILELRERAERVLGDRFDIRAFHDHLLGAGAIPLDALEDRMDRWLKAEREAR